MSQTVVVELPDPVYDQVKETAEATGSTPAEWIAQNVEQWLPHALTVQAVREELARTGLQDPALRMLDEWLADESGYDERTWPVVKQLIEENRTSDRKRFDE